MTRRARIHYPGAVYHALSRGNGGKDIFCDQEDYRRFLGELLAFRPLGLTVQAYCLMPNHFHLLVEAADVPLSDGMQLLLSRYAQYFNYRRGTFGHVFQGRHKQLLCRRDSYFMELIRYIHLNPVRAGLAAAAQDWPWSSHRAILGLEESPLVDVGRPLAMFGPAMETARAAYRDFHDLAKNRVDKPREDPIAHPASVDLIVRDCARECAVALSDVRGRSQRRDLSRCRRLAAKRALDCGHSRAKIAEYFGCDPSAISKMARGESFTQSFTP